MLGGFSPQAATSQAARMRQARETKGVTAMSAHELHETARAIVADHKGMSDEEIDYYTRSGEPTPMVADPVIKYLTDDQKLDLIEQLRAEMQEVSKQLQFEKAAELRDSITELEKTLSR